MSVVRGCRALLVISLLFVAAAASGGESIDGGSVKFAKNYRYAGQTFDKGRYQVQVEMAADGPTIVLSRDGAEKVRELAVVQTGKAKSGAKKGTSRLSMNAKDEGRYRLTVSHGGMHYLVFLESASM